MYAVWREGGNFGTNDRLRPTAERDWGAMDGSTNREYEKTPNIDGGNNIREHFRSLGCVIGQSANRPTSYNLEDERQVGKW